MVREDYKVNDGEGFNLNDKRIEYAGYTEYITFVYTDHYGLLVDDDFCATHGDIVNDFAESMMPSEFPGSDPDKVRSFFSDCGGNIELVSYGNYNYKYSSQWWDSLYETYTEYGLKPAFDDVLDFAEFITPILRNFCDTIEEIKATSIDGRVFILGDNTAVLTFWWQETPVSQQDVFTIISGLKDRYPRLKGMDFYIALANKVVPLEEFTGDFEASDEDVEQAENQKEVHLMNSADKHKALNPYLKDRAKRQGRKLQMSNGDEMTRAEYNSYLHQEGIKRMVKGVILEYLNLKTKLVIR